MSKSENKEKKTTSVNKKSKKGEKKSFHFGRIYLFTSFNNTILTFTDEKGHPKAWSSAGVAGFKGARKSTPFAGQKAAEDLNNKISRFNVKEVDVYLKGPGMAKQLTLKELANGGYRINSLRDITPIKFGGTTPRKQPRK